MNFANPLALIAFLAVPLVVVLYLIRPRRRTVVLSTTALWEAVLRERRASLGLNKLLKNLSLLALTAVAVLLALGLGDPRWMRSAATLHDAVIVIDTSASMQVYQAGTSRFDAAIAAAEELVAARPPGGRILIMASASKATLRSAFEDDNQALLAAIDALQVTDEEGAPRPAIELALTLLRDRERGRVYFITDRAFDGSAGVAGGHVEVIDVGGAADNVSISQFDVRAEVGHERRYQVLIEVSNAGGAAVTVPVRVELGGRTLVDQPLTVAAGDAERLIATFGGAPRGQAQARIDIDDALDADNVAWAVLAPDNVRLVALFSTGNFFLESVLDAFANVVVTRIDELQPAALAQHAQWNDLVIVDRMAVPQLPPGRFLLLDTMAPSLPVSTVSAPRVAPVVTGVGTSALVRDLDLGALQLEAARVAEAAPTGPGAVPLIWSEQGPIALGYVGAGVRLVWVGFDPGASNWPQLASYPLFLANAVEWLAPVAPGAAQTQRRAGQPFTVAVPPEADEVRVTSPDGEVRTGLPEGPTWRFDDTSVAGLYRVDAGAETAFFAVNVTSAAESDVSPRATVPAPPTAVGEQAELMRRGVALWPYLVGLALLLLAAEWLAYGARRLNA